MEEFEKYWACYSKSHPDMHSAIAVIAKEKHRVAWLAGRTSMKREAVRYINNRIKGIENEFGANIEWTLTVIELKLIAGYIGEIK